ncbi:SmpA / OmlA family protein [Oryzisolibacter propanilivorax]|uniref:SmpA / OmlA family protein n=1 Tax=Oryzisolibacter propanilivorax TaxID=1527607 RepID=A0A1G9RFX9_9BURK|nr:outer membrane protein assembly factor BamE [Oryzisolibacter propanilivorax]SDM22134.1 SmpA / OmlA family protein [Oryzisolibacter propanilivorax]
MAAHWIRRAGGAALALLALVGCDEQRIRELEEGVSTEVQVRERFGEPDRIWDDGGGSRTLEYDRQPAGRRNYMITIGPDGRMSALQQVLAPHHFAKVQPGMRQDQVRRLLGRPAKRAFYALKQQGEWDWYWSEDAGREMVFTVVFDAAGRVLRSGSSERLHEGP